MERGLGASLEKKDGLRGGVLKLASIRRSYPDTDPSLSRGPGKDP